MCTASQIGGYTQPRLLSSTFKVKNKQISSFSTAFAICLVSLKFPIPCLDFIQRPAFFAYFFCNALCHPRMCGSVSHP